MKITIESDAESRSAATPPQGAKSLFFGMDGDGSASDGGGAQAGEGMGAAPASAEQDGGPPPQALLDSIAASEAGLGGGGDRGSGGDRFGGAGEGNDAGAGPSADQERNG